MKHSNRKSYFRNDNEQMSKFLNNRGTYIFLLGGIALVLIGIPSVIRGDYSEFFKFEYHQDSSEPSSLFELFLIGIFLIIISVWRLIKKSNLKNASR
jgi:hypothetical membrane protein